MRYSGRCFIRARGFTPSPPPGGWRPEHRGPHSDGPEGYFKPACVHNCNDCWALEMNAEVSLCVCQGCGHSGGAGGEWSQMRSSSSSFWIDYPCDRCTATCWRCGPYIWIDGLKLCKTCQMEISEKKAAVVVNLHFEQSQVSCRLMSGREVLRQELEEREGQLVQIRAALTEQLPHFVPEHMPRLAWDRRAYTQDDFAKYYGDAAAALWAEAARRTFELHLVLPDGTKAAKEADAGTALSPPVIPSPEALTSRSPEAPRTSNRRRAKVWRPKAVEA